MGLSEKAMLVDLTIKKWSAVKSDKRIAEAAASVHGADATMMRGRRDLIARTHLEAISQVAAAAYKEHERRTLPWVHKGARILSAGGFLDYRAEMRTRQQQFESAVAAFVPNYPAYYQDAKLRQNGLFNPGEMPEPSSIADRYGWNVVTLPLPDADDFRVGLANGELARIRAEIQQAADSAVALAMRDVAERIRGEVGHLVDRLAGYTGGRDGSFRDSLIGNIGRLVDILPSLNLTGDPVIADVISDMRGLIVPVETLRDDERVRAATLESAENILSKMGAFV